MNDMERYVMGMALTNGHGYGPSEGGTLIECDYCGNETERQLVCPNCGGEFCTHVDCMMPAGVGVPCLPCEEGSPCDVEDD